MSLHQRALQKFFTELLRPHIWMQLLLRGLTMSWFFGLVEKVQFLDNPYFPWQVNQTASKTRN